MNKILLYIFIIVELFLCTLSASQINFNQNSKKILLQSEIYIDKENLNFNQIQKKTNFININQTHINLGFVKATKLWVKLDFYNAGSSTISKILEIDNPLLESAILYEGEKRSAKGILYKDDLKHSVNTIFELTLNAKEFKRYYLEITNTTTALRLEIHLQDKEIFLREEMIQQALIFLFFGILFMLYVYMTILFMYTKEKSYIYYSFYLIALIAQQATYLGVSQIFLPSWLLYYDNLGVVFKVNILYITAAIFVKSFLQTKEYPRIDRLYNLIIIVAFVEMPLFGFSSFYYPEVAILTGFFFVMFNMFVGVFVYRNGYKQARFFVIGWSFLFVGFTLMILDGLGVISFMQKTPNLIMYLTALEAILLSLAFTDRYIMLKEEKVKLVDTLTQHKSVIELEIERKTKHLNAALKNEKVILRELQHRTKNNLQLILSLTRMQADSASAEVKGYLRNLENRINAIAKTHEALYLKDDLHYISMDDYLEDLCNDLESLTKKELIFEIEARQVYMPIREAGYVGLIINELITNAIKYVDLSNIIFFIELRRIDALYIIELRDNGSCYEYDDIAKKNMGLKLVNTLVKDQLDGTISVNRKNGCLHTIEFKL